MDAHRCELGGERGMGRSVEKAEAGRRVAFCFHSSEIRPGALVDSIVDFPIRQQVNNFNF